MIDFAPFAPSETMRPSGVPPFFAMGRGRPLVFLHGWSTHAGFFRPQLALADAGFRVVLPDLPGHGRNPAAGRHLGLGDLAEALDALLVRETTGDAVVVGWSMGAAVAFEHVRRTGGSGMAGLIVVDMTARILSAPDWDLGLSGGLVAAQVERAAASMRARWPVHAGKIARRLFAASRPVTDPAVAASEAAIAAADGAVMADLWCAIAMADHRAVLPRIAVPTLMISGAESQLYGTRVGAALAAAIPHGRHTILPRTGHAPHLEAPDAFNDLVLAFLATDAVTNSEPVAALRNP